MESREHMQATEREYGGNMHSFIRFEYTLQASFVSHRPGHLPIAAGIVTHRKTAARRQSRSMYLQLHACASANPCRQGPVRA